MIRSMVTNSMQKLKNVTGLNTIRNCTSQIKKVISEKSKYHSEDLNEFQTMISTKCTNLSSNVNADDKKEFDTQYQNLTDVIKSIKYSENIRNNYGNNSLDHYKGGGNQEKTKKEKQEKQKLGVIKENTKVESKIKTNIIIIFVDNHYINKTNKIYNII